MFRVVFFSLWIALHAYLAWRVSSVPAVAGRVRARWVWLAAALLGASFPLSRVFERSAPTTLAVALEWFASHWLGVLILLVTCLLAVDVVTAFGLAFRRRAARLRGLALLLGLALTGIAFVQGMRAPVVEEHEVRVEGLPPDADGLTLVAVTDTHLGALIGADWLEERVAEIEALDPDLVVLVGDIVEGHGEPDPDGRFAAILRRLSPPLGVYAVLGNHEGHSGGAPARRFFEAAGARVLTDEWVPLRPGVVIAGVEDPRLARDRRTDGDARRDRDAELGARIRRALAGRPDDAATILLVHQPRAADVAAAEGADLFLAGHTHAGQIWPFSYISKAIHPLFDGRYDVDGMTVIVSRGAGTWGPRMRLWKPAALPLVTLRAASSAPPAGAPPAPPGGAPAAPLSASPP